MCISLAGEHVRGQPRTQWEQLWPGPLMGDWTGEILQDGLRIADLAELVNPAWKLLPIFSLAKDLRGSSWLLVKAEPQWRVPSF